MDRSARPCRPLGHFAGRRAGRGFVASYRRKPGHLDRDLAAALFHRARGVAEGRYVGRWRAVRQRHALLPLARHRGEIRRRPVQADGRFHAAEALPRAAFRGHSPVPACDIEQSRMVLSGWRFVQRYVWHQGQSAFAEPEIMARPLDHPKQPRFELRAGALSFEIMRAEVHDLTSRNAARPRPRRLGRRRSQRRRAVEHGRLPVPACRARRGRAWRSMRSRSSSPISTT